MLQGMLLPVKGTAWDWDPGLGNGRRIYLLEESLSKALKASQNLRLRTLIR